MIVVTLGFQQAMIKDMTNIGRHTWISVDIKIRDMGNVGRHTRISADINKIHGQC